MTISESHRQMLRTMLQYELDNYVTPKINKVDGQNLGANEINLINAKNYLQERIKALAE